MTDQRRTLYRKRSAPSLQQLVWHAISLIIAVALLLLKLLLVSQREIVTEQHDAEGYVSASLG